MHTKFRFLVESFFVSSQTLYWKALKPHDLFRFNTQRIQVLWNHIAVLIALLLTHRTLTQLKYRSTTP